MFKTLVSRAQRVSKQKTLNVPKPMKPTLILLCDNYPLRPGEFFLDDEIKIIHPHFEKIYVLIKNQDQQELNRFIPENLEVIKYNSRITANQKLKAITKIISPIFIGELIRAIFKYKISTKPIMFKIMFMDIVRSNQIIHELESLISNQSLNLNNTVIYSYWHDYRALALARLTKSNPNIKTVARAHRWDIYFYANKFSYLPYKKFIIDNLSKTISISNDGAHYFEKLLDENLDERLSISRLGKVNSRARQIQKKDNQILICSCSTLTPVKRLNLIIDLIGKLKIEDLKWIHFGDGYLREEIQTYAQQKLRKNNFEFKGIVSNNEILDFYSQNYVDLFINLSESEGIPVSIMEALSAGIPVMATDVGGTAEAVNTENGFLIKKDFDLTEVVTTIEIYLKSSRENQIQLRQNSYKFWQQNYEANKNYTEFANKLLQL